MFTGLEAIVGNLPLAVQLIGLMAVVAAGDFLAAVIDAARHGTFQGSLLGKWVGDKGLPIVTVALLYALDQAVSLATVTIGDIQLGAFGALAYAQGVSFIIGEIASIRGHLQASASEDQPVEDGGVGPGG